MNNLKVFLAGVVVASSLGFATAGYANNEGPACNGTYELDKVVVNGVPDCIRIRADNGWGNGLDGENAGSDDGLTAGTKLDSGDDSGPGPDKFDGQGR